MHSRVYFLRVYFLVMAITVPQVLAGEEIPLPEAAALIGQRYQAISALDIQVESVTTGDPAGLEYSKAKNEYRTALQVYAGIPPTQSNVQVELGSPIEERFRLRLRSGECLRIDELAKDDKEVAYWVYRGEHWESYIDPKGRIAPAVTVDQSMTVPSIQIIAGLGVTPRFGIPNYFHTCDARQVHRWDEFFTFVSEHAGSGESKKLDFSGMRATLDSMTGDLLVTFSASNADIIECAFRKDYGYAITRIAGRLPSEATLGSHFSAEWSDFRKVDKALWFPSRLQVERFGRMVIVPSDGFKAKNPGEKNDPSNLDLDLSNVKSEDYRIDVQDCKIRVVSPAPSDCEYTTTSYVAGTIIEDRRTGEVFQLTGVGPAVDAQLKRIVSTADDLAGTPPPGPMKSRMALIVLNVIAGIFVIIVAIRARKAKGK